MKQTSVSELRKFGLSVGAVFLLFAGLTFYFGKSFYWVFILVGTPLVILGATIPSCLNATYYWWMKLAEKISVVTTFIILVLSFTFAIIPMGLFLRLIGKDILSMKLDKSAKSYWITIEEETRTERYTTPY